MATISARRRRIRDGAVRSNELIRRMVQFPSAPVRTTLRNPMAHQGKWCQPVAVSRRLRKKQCALRRTGQRQWFCCREWAGRGRNLLHGIDAIGITLTIATAIADGGDRPSPPARTIVAVHAAAVTADDTSSSVATRSRPPYTAGRASSRMSNASRRL